MPKNMTILLQSKFTSNWKFIQNRVLNDEN